MNGWSELAHEFVRLVLDIAGQQLDFSLESLATLDDLLDEWLHLSVIYGGERPAGLDHLTLPLVSYVGETLRRAFGGTWVTRDDRPLLAFRPNITLDLFPLVQRTLTHQQPPAFARLATALDRALEESNWL